MRYTKAALLTFGLGLLLGLVVVVGEFFEWERVASSVIALGLALIPVGLFADGHGVAAIRWLIARRLPGKRKAVRAKERPAGPRRKTAARPAAPRLPARKRG